MDKLNISIFPGCVKKTLEYIKTALKALHVSAADSEALLGSAGEIISAICAADANGSVIVSAEKSAKGCCVQFMHLGALFNPCPKAPDSITQNAWTKFHLNSNTAETFCPFLEEQTPTKIFKR